MLASSITKHVSGKRGRPSREGERTITATILNAALQLFLEHGYGATSMKRIGEVAGVAPNTLYARFPEKAALFKAIIEWKAETWRETNPSSLAPPGSSLYDVLRVAIIAMLEAMDRQDISAIGQLLELEAVRFPELASIYHEFVTSAAHAGLTASILTSRGCELSQKEAEDVARTVFECLIGHMKLQILNRNDNESREAAADRIARLLTGAGGPTRHNRAT